MDCETRLDAPLGGASQPTKPQVSGVVSRRPGRRRQPHRPIPQPAGMSTIALNPGMISVFAGDRKSRRRLVERFARRVLQPFDLVPNHQFSAL
jgi:hypothetical protein